MVALARAAQRQAGPRYAAGAQSNRVTDGSTPHATARSVEVNAGGVQHNLTRLTLSSTFTPHGSTTAAAHHAAQSNSALGATGELCTTEYISTRDERGSYVRMSVDCAD
jgi:hypothetical protein